mmetsp:Transcript_9949/g.24018  ORF Transcript_9949/g.24018 Transcript_9949/m.24018 type:complete len:436 (+) Transcript_9949:53-1360(+)
MKLMKILSLSFVASLGFKIDGDANGPHEDLKPCKGGMVEHTDCASVPVKECGDGKQFSHWGLHYAVVSGTTCMGIGPRCIKTNQTSFLTTDYVPYESSGTKLWGTEGELGLMKKPFTAMAWVKFAGQGSYGNAILTISDRENGRSGTGIGFNQGYGSFARFGKSLCRGCSHWTYYQSFKDLWVHQAFAVNPVTGKVLMYREGRLIHSCSNVFPADDMDDFFVVTAAKAAHGDVYDVKIFKDEFKSHEEIVAEMRYAPHPDRAVEYLSYDRKELQDFGQRGKMPDLLYLISVTAMAWVHVKSKLSGEHPIFTWNEESHATESKSAVGGGLQPGQGHGIYLNMGNGRCEGGDLDAPEGSWIHVAFAFDFFEKTVHLFKDGKLVKTCTDYRYSVTELHVMTSAARAGGDVYDFKLYRTPIIEEEYIRELMGPQHPTPK